jgi:hypothetical protein
MARSRGVLRRSKWSGIGNAADPRRPLAGPPQTGHEWCGILTASRRIGADSVICLAMKGWLRKSAVLVAAYAIALQAMLWGFVSATHVGFDPFAIICSTDGSGDHAPSPPQHTKDCDACLSACNGSPALLPASFAFSSVIFAERPKRLTLVVEAPSPRPRHEPQESRAPPLSS